MAKTDESAESVPTFTITADDPLAPGLIRYWLGAARARGSYPQASIRHGEQKLQEFQSYRQRKAGKR